MLNKCVVYIDKPAAWRAPVAGFIAQFFLMGYTRSFGLLLLALHESFDVPKALLLPTAIVAMGLEKLLAPLTEQVSRYFGEKTALVSSAIIGSGSLFACYFLPLTGGVVMAFLGVGIGIAGALAPLPVYNMTAMALRRHRGIGFSFVKSGVSLGAICFPPLFVFLTERYEARGALLISAGMLTNIFISAVLLPSQVIDGETGKTVSSVVKWRSVKLCTKKRSDDDGDDCDVNVNLKTPCAEIEKKPLNVRFPFLVYFCAIITISLISFSQQVTVYPLFASEIGLSSYTIAATMSLQSCVDLFWRFGTGFINDRLRDSKRLLVMSAFFLTAGSITLTLGISPGSVPMSFIFSIVFGLGLAQMAAGWVPVLVGFTNITHLARGMSVILTAVGLFSVSIAILIKVVISSWNTYRPLILIYGSLIVFAGLNLMISGLIFHSCLRKRSSNIQLKIDDDNENLSEDNSL